LFNDGRLGVNKSGNAKAFVTNWTLEADANKFRIYENNSSRNDQRKRDNMYLTQESESSGDLTLNGYLYIKNDWSIRPTGDFLEFHKSNVEKQRFTKDGNIYDMNEKLMRLDHRHYRIRSNGGNRCTDFNASDGWYNCQDNNDNQKAYFDKY
ncbi:hypothetical protein EB118_03425, partial [bacterium]|nr:hypothetical protein [bacterium]NDC94029.1 hypothetical protein [bacterium]NDD82715.1 hypothetical protein [bacterium]NDG29136.1 hypothetical protein [bacterium]